MYHLGALFEDLNVTIYCVRRYRLSDRLLVWRIYLVLSYQTITVSYDRSISGDFKIVYEYLSTYLPNQT